MPTPGAARNNARTGHIQVSFGKVFRCPTMDTLSLRSSNVEGKYSVQLTSGGIAV